MRPAVVERSLLERLKRAPCLRVDDEIVLDDDTPDGAIPAWGETSSDDKRAIAQAARLKAEWNQNLSRAKRALTKHGVSFGKQLGCGSYGCAFLAELDGEEIVCKITGDRAEAAAAQGVIRALAEKRTSKKKLAALVDLLCVYAFVDQRGAQIPIYAVLQRRVQALSDEEVDFIDRYRWSLVARAEEVYGRARQELGPDGVRNVRRVQATRDELRKIGIEWTDLHGGNVLADDAGGWVIIDLGASNSDSPVDVPAIEARGRS